MLLFIVFRLFGKEHQKPSCLEEKAQKRQKKRTFKFPAISIFRFLKILNLVARALHQQKL